MNSFPGMIPDWAEAELKRTAQPSPFDRARFDTLEKFYKAWEALHAIPPSKLNKRKKEEAAQELVGQAHILRRMYAERVTLDAPPRNVDEIMAR